MYLGVFIEREFISNYHRYISFKKRQNISCDFRDILYNITHKPNKDDLITYTEFKCTHEVFRVPVAYYKRLRRKHLSVLALIY